MTLAGRLARWRGQLDHSVAVVVFTVPEKRLREMDVATGPCVPTGGRKKPLAGVLRQDGGEYPHQTAALYTALTGEPSHGALELLQQQRRGSLYVCSGAFVDAMADAHAESLTLIAEDEANGNTKEYPAFIARQNEIADEWLGVGDWPPSVVGTGNRLGRMAWAATAGQRGQRLYVWHGPRVQEYVVRSGRG